MSDEQEQWRVACSERITTTGGVQVNEMDPERWRKIEELYHAALELEGGGRAAFLERTCGGDDD